MNYNWWPSRLSELTLYQILSKLSHLVSEPSIFYYHSVKYKQKCINNEKMKKKHLSGKEITDDNILLIKLPKMKNLSL